MTATIEPPQYRRRASFSWAEFLPRYLLVEAACRGRRVLEIGTLDPRSLARLKEGGAEQIVGTAPDPKSVDPTGLLKRSVELVAMPDGQVDFPEGAFDVVLVVDLARQIATAPKFLTQIRRVLGPDGFALLGFESGRGLSRLVGDPTPPPLLEPRRIEMAVRAVFQDARFYQQTPFIGVAIQPQGTERSDVPVDPSLAATGARPSHVIALAGRGAPDGFGPKLVELPFLDFEATAQAAQARSAADVERLMQALADARSEVAKRDESLRAIGERLPRLKRAFEEKLAEARGASTSGPTFVGRPSEVLTDIPLAEAVEPSPAVKALEAELTRMRSAYDAAERARETAESQELEAHQRIRELQRTIDDRELRLERLAADIDKRLSAEAALSEQHQDAQMRMKHLAHQLDEVHLAHAGQVRRLEERIAELTEALVTQQGATITVEADASESTARAIADIASEADREALRQLRIERDELRVRLQEQAQQVELLQGRINAQDAAIARLGEESRTVDPERLALELAATQMAHEVDTLQQRVQTLRSERDALAATSQMLLDERDELAALSEAGGIGTTGPESIALARLETELAAANARADAHKKALVSETERRQQVESALEASTAEYDQLQRVLHEVASTASSNAQALATAERRCRQLEATAGDALDQVGRALSAKASAEAKVLEVQRRSQAAISRAANLQADVAALGHRLTGRVRELEQARATVRAIRAELAQKADPDRAERAERAGRVGELEHALATVRQEKSSLEMALGRTLDEAAALGSRLEVIEKEHAEIKVALERSEGNRERLAAAVETLRRELDEALADRDEAEQEAEALKSELERLQGLEHEQQDRPETTVVDFDEPALRQQLETLKIDRLAARQEAREADLRARQLALRLDEVQAELRAATAASARLSGTPGQDVAGLRLRVADLTDEAAFLRTLVADRDRELRQLREEAGRETVEGPSGPLDVPEPVFEGTEGETLVPGSAPGAMASEPAGITGAAVAEWRMRAVEAEAEVLSLRQAITAHRSAVADQDQVQARLTDQVERLQRAVMSLEDVAESRTKELAEARHKLQEAEDALLEQAESLMGPDFDLYARLTNLQSSIEVVRAERDRAEAELARRSEALAAEQMKAAAFADRLADRERSTNDTEELLARLRAVEQERVALDRGRLELADQLETARAAARAAEDKVTAFGRKTAQAEARVVDARAEVLAIRTERDDLAETLDGLRVALMQAKEEARRLRLERRGGSAPAPASDDRVEALAREAEDYRPALVQAEQRLAVAKALAESADAQLSDTVTELEMTRRHLAQAEAHIGRLEDEMAKTRNESARLAARVAQLERSHAEAQSGQASAQRTTASAQERLQQADEAVVGERRQREAAERALKDLQAKHDTVRQALEEARIAADALRSEKDALEVERDALVAEVGALPSPSNLPAADPLKAKLRSLEASHEQLVRRLQGAEAERDGAQARLDEAADRVAGLQKIAFENAGDAHRLAADRGSLEQVADDLRSRLAAAEMEAETAGQQLSSAVRQIDDLRGQLDTARSAKDELATALRQTSGSSLSPDEVAALEARAASSDLKSLQDDARLVAAETEIDLVRTQLHHLNHERQRLVEERHRLESRLNAGEEHRRQALHRIAELETQLDEQNVRVERLEREIQEKNERIRRLSGLAGG